MNTCFRFINNECKFNESSCWYNHNTKNANKTTTEEHKNVYFNDKTYQPNDKDSTQPPVFQNPPANMAPPSMYPNQATWVKMMSMMKDLNQMMTNIKKQNLFQSL